jgi:acyl-coenzyme A synthetase/AMP-(fatty) acid ligase
MDCAVIGMAHEDLGEAPVACIVLDDTVDWNPDELLAHCRKSLSSCKAPDKFVVVSEIPRTGSGKIMRARLRETL